MNIYELITTKRTQESITPPTRAVNLAIIRAKGLKISQYDVTEEHELPDGLYVFTCNNSPVTRGRVRGCPSLNLEAGRQKVLHTSRVQPRARNGLRITTREVKERVQ